VQQTYKKTLAHLGVAAAALSAEALLHHTVITALSSMEYACTRYPATWAAWTLLILFSEMLKLIF
jgi:hypothetical protein